MLPVAAWPSYQGQVDHHIARGRFRREDGKVTHNSLVWLGEEAPALAEQLADAGMDAIAFNCTGSSIAGGHRSSERIVAQIERATGKPATTTILSIIRALRAMGIRRLGLAGSQPEIRTVLVHDAQPALATIR